MINGMYLSTMGAMCQWANHENIANNLANAETNGFKPDFATFMSIPAESVMQGMGRRESDLILEKTGGGAWMDRTMHDFTPGPMQTTGNALDVAINDNNTPGRVSFFKVALEGDGGNTVAYTRNGNFIRNKDGLLVTTEGRPVLGDGDAAITIPNGQNLQVNRNGSITVEIDGQVQIVGQIGLASTTTEQAEQGMKKLGDSLFVPNDELEESAIAQMEDGGGEIASGVLEGSSTRPIYEMVNMINGQRAYELNMKFLSLQDSTLGAAISQLRGS